LGVPRGGPSGLKGMDRMAHALRGAAQLLGDLGRALPAPTGQQHLAASQGKGVRGTEPGCQLLALLGRSRANLERWFHPP
jgi:hypothetical protein